MVDELYIENSERDNVCARGVSATLVSLSLFEMWIYIHIGVSASWRLQQK